MVCLPNERVCSDFSRLVHEGSMLPLVAANSEASDIVGPEEPQDRVHPPDVLNRALQERAQRSHPDRV